MRVTVRSGKAWLWLIIVYQAYGIKIASPPTAPTTFIPEIITVTPESEVINQDESNAEKDTTVPYPLPPLGNLSNFVTEKPKQKITINGNITSIKVLCPSARSPLSLLDTTPISNNSAFITSLSNSTTSSSNSGDYFGNVSSDYYEGISSPRILSGQLAKVDLGALEIDKNLEVEVEYKDCQRVVVDIEIPHWVERLSLSTKEGSAVFQKGWAKGGSNLKKLWFRMSKGLFIDPAGLAVDDSEINIDIESTSGTQELCSILPPTLELLDVSHTPLEVLYMDTTCSSKLTRLEASHSLLTTVALCTPTLVSLHLSWNSLEGSLHWMTCMDGLAAVEYLQLNQNSLSEVSTCGWTSLRSLDLRRNVLSSLDLSSCPSSNLTNVTASHNQLVTPPILPSALQKLDLSHNKLESLPMITSTLVTADFSHNNIIEIGKSRFKRARKLLHLSLAFNHITHIKEHDLNGLRELRTLDLSHNRLREIAGTSLMSLRHLRKLYLHHNHLNTLDVRDLAALSHRAFATLHHNPWHCGCQLLASLQRLQYCRDCQHQVVPVECRERGTWMTAAPLLTNCLQAVQEVTQRLDDESDEDLSEEEGGDGARSDVGGSGTNKGAVVVVPVLLILIIIGAVIAMSYRLYHRHKRIILARLNPICNRCPMCGLCGCSPMTMNNGDLNHHHHGELSQMEQDSDTETEL